MPKHLSLNAITVGDFCRGGRLVFAGSGRFARLQAGTCSGIRRPSPLSPPPLRTIAGRNRDDRTARKGSLRNSVAVIGEYRHHDRRCRRRLRRRTRLCTVRWARSGQVSSESGGHPWHECLPRVWNRARRPVCPLADVQGSAVLGPTMPATYEAMPRDSRNLTASDTATVTVEYEACDKSRHSSAVDAATIACLTFQACDGTMHPTQHGRTG